MNGLGGLAGGGGQSVANRCLEGQGQGQGSGSGSGSGTVRLSLRIIRLRYELFQHLLPDEQSFSLCVPPAA